MESFSIVVDLSSFYDDLRSKSVVFVNKKTMEKVTHVEKHIKALFGIDSQTYISSHNNFVPGAEDSSVLKILQNIRLETASFSKKATENHNGHEEDKKSESTSSQKRKRDEIPYVDKGDIAETGHSSKKKKHKKKRGDVDDVSGESSTLQYSISEENSSLPIRTDSSKAGKVRKPTSNNRLYTEVSSLADSSSVPLRKIDETPNGEFYDVVHTDTYKSAEKFIEEFNKEILGENSGKVSEAKTCDTDSTTEVGEAEKDNEGSDSNTNTEVSSVKPKRKRIRKRKKGIKVETPDEDTEITAQQVVKPTTAFEPKSYTSNSKHIYFPEEVVDDFQTSVGVPEDENTDAEYTTKRSPEEPSHIKAEVTIDQEVYNNEHNVPKDSVKYTGTNIPRTVCLPIVETTTKPNWRIAKAGKGLGPLLSLIRSEHPPVFERRKALKNADIPKVPQQTFTKSAIRSSTSSETASLPDKNPIVESSQSKAVTLKALPDEGMKISFQMLKMSASYCPELSNPIVAAVVKVDSETRNLTLKIISGAEECRKPKGKFDLLDPEDPEEEATVDQLTLNWEELIEPSLSQ